MRRFVLFLAFCAASLPAWGLSRECIQCHEPIVKEWATSAHAMAHASTNELYAKMVAAVAKAKGVTPADVGAKCDVCHAPVTDAGIAGEGVTCVACHRIDALAHQDAAKPPVGRNMIAWMKERVMAGPTGSGQSPYHGIARREFMQGDNDALCLTCHNVMKNDQSVTVCNTGTEYRQGALQGRVKKSCIACHMGEARPGYVSSLSTSKRPMRSHGFHGARNSDILQDAMTLEMTSRSGELAVTLTNLSSHSFPTGSGARSVTVGVTLFDGHGQTVATHTEKIAIGFVAADGNATLPPLAAGVGSDSRLAPGEVRTYRYVWPAEGVRAEAKIVYRLAAEPLVRRFELKDRRLTTVYPVAVKTIDR